MSASFWSSSRIGFSKSSISIPVLSGRSKLRHPREMGDFCFLEFKKPQNRRLMRFNIEIEIAMEF
jgi:hypothetical protein